MKVQTETITLSTQGNADIVNITPQIQDMISKSDLVEGSAVIFVVGSTASISTIEYEGGLKKDLPELMERLISSDENYQHNLTWGDKNGHSHLRATMFGCSQVIPFIKSELMLGTWQQVVLIDFDERPRTRTVVIQLSGK